MALRITYQDINGERHDIEWIADSTWTAERSIAAFRKRHPDATILACLRIEESCTAL